MRVKNLGLVVVGLVLFMFMIGSVFAIDCTDGSCGKDDPGFYRCVDNDGPNDASPENPWAGAPWFLPQAYINKGTAGTITQYGSGTELYELSDMCWGRDYVLERYCIENLGHGIWTHMLIPCPTGTICVKEEDSAKCSPEIPDCGGDTCGIIAAGVWHCIDTDYPNTESSIPNWALTSPTPLWGVPTRWSYINYYEPGEVKIFTGTTEVYSQYLMDPDDGPWEDDCNGNNIIEYSCYDQGAGTNGFGDSPGASEVPCPTGSTCIEFDKSSQATPGYCALDCMDSDSGGNDEEYRPGATIRGYFDIDADTEAHYDSCIDTDSLTEYSCDTNQKYEDLPQTIDCSHKCQTKTIDGESMGECCSEAVWTDDWGGCINGYQQRTCEKVRPGDPGNPCLADCNPDNSADEVITGDFKAERRLCCGNGELNNNAGELCDSTANPVFGPKTCITEGFYGGDLICTASCTIEYDDCTTCTATQDPETTCVGEIDEDCDRLTDCADSDCDGDAACSDECDLAGDWEALWVDSSDVEISSAEEKDSIRLIIQNTNAVSTCAGNVQFTLIEEADCLGLCTHDDVTPNINPTQFTLSKSSIGSGGNWAAEWHLDNWPGSGDPEYIFTACLVSDPSECITSADGDALTVTKHCGNNICEAIKGETTVTCPDDCGAGCVPDCSVNGDLRCFGEITNRQICDNTEGCLKWRDYQDCTNVGTGTGCSYNPYECSDDFTYRTATQTGTYNYCNSGTDDCDTTDCTGSDIIETCAINEVCVDGPGGVDATCEEIVSIFWANMLGGRITTAELGDSVLMIYKDKGASTNTFDYIFKESDGVLGITDIRTILAANTFDQSGDLAAPVTITQQDMDDSDNLVWGVSIELDAREFRFEVDSIDLNENDELIVQENSSSNTPPNSCY